MIIIFIIITKKLATTTRCCGRGYNCRLYSFCAMNLPLSYNVLTGFVGCSSISTFRGYVSRFSWDTICLACWPLVTYCVVDREVIHNLPGACPRSACEKQKKSTVAGLTYFSAMGNPLLYFQQAFLPIILPDWVAGSSQMRLCQLSFPSVLFLVLMLHMRMFVRSVAIPGHHSPFHLLHLSSRDLCFEYYFQLARLFSGSRAWLLAVAFAGKYVWESARKFSSPYLYEKRIILIVFSSYYCYIFALGFQ